MVFGLFAIVGKGDVTVKISSHCHCGRCSKGNSFVGGTEEHKIFGNGVSQSTSIEGGQAVYALSALELSRIEEIGADPP